MADLDAIRQGLAANLVPLRTAGTVGQVSAYLLDNPTPISLQIVGVENADYDTEGFGAGEHTWRILVEAVLGVISDIGSQKNLNALLETDAVKDALESNRTLTSRLGDDGQVTAEQTAAASRLKVTRYRGHARARVGNGAEMLVAVWEVEVTA